MIVPVGGFALLVLLALAYWHFHMAPVSRRLIGAAKGTLANQKDLPYELRGRFEAVSVLGSGAFGVVIEAWQVHRYIPCYPLLRAYVHSPCKLTE